MYRKGRLLPIFSVLRKYKSSSLRYFPLKVNIITSSFLKKIHKILHRPFSPQPAKNKPPSQIAPGNVSKLALIGFVLSLPPSAKNPINHCYY